jgi:hypothetical protein
MTLSELQKAREENLGDKYSAIFTWAMNIAISEMIGLSALTVLKNDIPPLLKAITERIEHDDEARSARSKIRSVGDCGGAIETGP